MKALRILSILLPMIAPYRAFGWGDDGHKTIALIGERYLEPAAKTKIGAMLDADPEISRRTTLRAKRPGQTSIETATIRLKTGTSSILKSMTPTSRQPALRPFR
jgi:hypothetical protein